MRNRFVLLWMLVCSVGPAIGQVSIGVGFPNMSIGINVPLYPDLVPVPGYPVYYAPGLNSNYFFYDGMYWVYQNDNWYASSWYNGPWGLVAPEDVPVYVLRVPVSYYRQPPGFFMGWQLDAPPRWGEHWGGEWEHRRAGWERWDHNSAPAPAPLPVYQRQYSGDRYPRAEQQHALQSQNDRYQPHDPEVRRQYEAQQGRSAPVSAQPGTQARPQAANPAPQGSQRSNSPAASVQQSAAVAAHAPAPQTAGQNGQKAALTKAPPQMENPPVQHPQQAAVQRQQQAPAPHTQATGPQGKPAPQAAERGQDPGQHPQQVAAQRQQPAPTSRNQETQAQGKVASQEVKRGQEPGPEKGRETAEDRGQEHK
jgi:hypothetical protein